MRKIKKTAISLMLVMTMVLATTLVAYAKETRSAAEVEYNPILPPTEASYRSYSFDIELPTCAGEGEYRLSKHYFDPDLQYGYPPMMEFSMSTGGICDFGANVCAVDQVGNYFYLQGGSSQSHGMYAKRTFTAMNTALIHVNNAAHPSTAWVCDDIDYGVCTRIGFKGLY